MCFQVLKSRDRNLKATVVLEHRERGERYYLVSCDVFREECRLGLSSNVVSETDPLPYLLIKSGGKVVFRKGREFLRFGEDLIESVKYLGHQEKWFL